MGAQPSTALAIAVVPFGPDSKTEQLLQQVMSGAVRILTAAGCTLAGGHTGEGQELALGLPFLLMHAPRTTRCRILLLKHRLAVSASHHLYRVGGAGFSIQGVVKEGQQITKSGAGEGNVLILTKALGTGTLMAAAMRGKAAGRDVQGTMVSLLV